MPYITSLQEKKERSAKKMKIPHEYIVLLLRTLGSGRQAVRQRSIPKAPIELGTNSHAYILAYFICILHTKWTTAERKKEKGKRDMVRLLLLPPLLTRSE